MNSSIGQLAYFLAVKLVPPFVIKLQIKLPNELCINEVDESIADITRVVGVDWEVEEVVLVSMI